MSGNPASSSEQNNNSYETKASLRMSEKKCCECWERGGAALFPGFYFGNIVVILDFAAEWE